MILMILLYRKRATGGNISRRLECTNNIISGAVTLFSPLDGAVQ